ncbi:hypothetical protein KBB48_02925 [Candidatus Shapirobacteria bacterium]|nr:hypothetical protein [Candidatus Shapirobacteria bacterium]
MKKNDTVANFPRTQFFINDPKLDIIALKIVWERDQKLWQNFVVKRYPVFDLIQEWNFKKIRTLLKQIYLDNQVELLQAQQNFRTWWGAVENSWCLFLEDFFELRIMKGVCFMAYIGISPIFPRDINSESFLVPLTAKSRDVLRICAHETSHFFFYRRAKEINFAVQPNEQHLWLTSEVLVPLLFSNPRSIDILGKMSQGSYVCTQSLVERCRKIYQERLEGKISSEELIRCLLQTEIKAGELNFKFFS